MAATKTTLCSNDQTLLVVCGMAPEMCGAQGPEACCTSRHANGVYGNSIPVCP